MPSPEEYREKINTQVLKVLDQDGWSLEHKFTGDDTSFDWIYIAKRKQKLTYGVYTFGIIDDRRPSPESLEKAQNELSEITWANMPTRGTLVTISVTDKIDPDARSYIESHNKIKDGSRFLYVIDASSRSAVYDKWPKKYYSRRKSQKKIKSMVIDEVL